MKDKEQKRSVQTFGSFKILYRQMASASEKDLNISIEYKLLSGEPSQTSVLNIIHHVMNHSTYHRGQLVTMGRELGFIDPPKPILFNL